MRETEEEKTLFCNYQIERQREDTARLFSDMHSSRARGDWCKLNCGKLLLTIRSFLHGCLFASFLKHKLIRYWSSLSRDTVRSPFLEMLKTKLGTILSVLIS